MGERTRLRRALRQLRRGSVPFFLCALLGAALSASVVAQQKGAATRLATNPRGERRVALVIGNSNYEPEIGRLKNPVNDASDVAAALRILDFEIIGGKAQLDVSLRQLDELVRAFGRELRRGGVGVFYFSGHGMQVNRVNYLLPLGARVEKEQDVLFEAFNVDRVLAEMEAAENKLNILILDACRNNPLTRSFRSGGRGLARPESVPTGTYVAFAARDRQVASDNAAGRNGLYTQELLKYIGQPGLRLEDIFINTRREVRRLSQNAQIPVEYGSIDAPFFFIEETSVTVPNPASPSLSSYRRWLTLLDNSNYTAVLHEADAELSRDPKNALALRARSGAYFGLYDVERGGRDIVEVGRRLANAESADEYEARCYVKVRLGQADEAVSDCTQAISLDPQLKWAYNNRGNAYYNKNDYDHAISDYTRAIDLDTKYARAYYNRGDAYSEKQDYDRAISDYTRAIDLDPKFARAYNNRGLAYRNKQEYDRAIADYTLAIEMDPKFALAYYNRRLAYLDRQEYDHAIADYKKAIGLDPKIAEVYSGLGDAYRNKQYYDRAISDYTRSIEQNPKDAVAYFGRGLAYRNKQEYDRAIADYTRAIELDPKFALAYKNRALAYEAKDNSARAAADRQKAAELEKPQP